MDAEFCKRLLLLERLLQLLESQFKGLRKNAGLGDRRHEIGVSGPARQDMHVDVTGHAGASRFTQIHAEIESMWAVNCMQVDLRQPDKLYHLDERRLGHRFQRSDVLIRHNHQVSRRVGIQVQNDEVMLSTMNNAVLFVPIFRVLDAKYAPGRLSGLADVLIPPGTPQIVHQGVGTGSVGEVWTAAAGTGEVDVFTMSF